MHVRRHPLLLLGLAALAVGAASAIVSVVDEAAAPAGSAVVAADRRHPEGKEDGTVAATDSSSTDSRRVGTGPRAGEGGHSERETADGRIPARVPKSRLIPGQRRADGSLVPFPRRPGDAPPPSLAPAGETREPEEAAPVDTSPPLLPEGLDAAARRRIRDSTEIRPWLKGLSPDDDHRFLPEPGQPERPAVAPKPVPRIAIQLTVTTNPAEGVTVKVNGRAVEGAAPWPMSLDLAMPGDLEVVAAKPGYATVTRKIRLGRDSPGGALPVQLDLPLDVPADDDPSAHREPAMQGR